MDIKTASGLWEWVVSTKPAVRGTFDLASSYDALNIVALNGSAFIARWNDPGECPGDGWQLIALLSRYL